jgi:Membrane bound O-acyl transferase family
VSRTVFAEVTPEQSIKDVARQLHLDWVGWIPLGVLPMAAMAARSELPAWAFMWLLAVAIFAGCKWQTWWEARGGLPKARSWKRSVCYLLLWRGMDPDEFFRPFVDKRQVPPNEWLVGIAKALAGVALIWAGAQVISLGSPLIGSWIGMVGIVLALHFGIFQLATLCWQRVGIPVTAIMQQPLRSHSLSELWGKRWNLGFRKLTHMWVFLPLQKRCGTAAATLGAFLVSGLLHDLVISVPARAGYGLPTAYFLLQGMGVIAERSETGRRFGLGRGARGLAWTGFVALGPLSVLFHPWFVMRVMVPFLRTVAG